MGEVYRARDTKLGRDVAIKVVAESFTHDPERVARFQREAQLLASLNHPHIATIYGLEEAQGSQFLAMELVEGERSPSVSSASPWTWGEPCQARRADLTRSAPRGFPLARRSGSRGRWPMRSRPPMKRASSIAI